MPNSRLRKRSRRPTSHIRNRVNPWAGYRLVWRDEPFGIPDIQFELPAIRVLPNAPGEIILEFFFILSVLHFRGNEFPRPVELGQTLPKRCIVAIMCRNYANCAGIAFPFVEHGRETACRLDRPDQPGDFEVSWQARIRHWITAHSRAGRTGRCASA